ncbi:DUF1294 domain-containing protein [Pseudomonas sp. LRF_L74]|uniref:DUF1294 domain-containing protein n=1 Tax=Pseudomonas sp. LRF_L74 TaxID=3369422 RepID=UPI003F61EE6B
MELRGTLRSWNDDKGFGFIRPEQGGADVFVHISAVRGDARPKAGLSVFYVAGKDEQGRLRAEHMRGEGLSLDRPAIRRKPKAAEAGPQESSRRQVSDAQRKRASGMRDFHLKLVLFALLLGMPLLGALLMFSKHGLVWPLLVYPVVSALSFFQYWGDKQSAQKGHWRTPESTLHLSELAGGWPGALIAQQVFRHKTRKASFQLVFWAIVMLHQGFWLNWLLGGRLVGQLLRGWLPY